MAPESFYDGTWDLVSDVWMFGVLLWGMHIEFWSLMIIVLCFTEIFTWAELPWKDVLDGDVMKCIQRKDKLHEPRENCPAEVYAVMLGCWRLDPNTRYDAGRIASEIKQAIDKAGGDSAVKALLWPTVDQAGAGLAPRKALDGALDVDTAEQRGAFSALEVAATSVTLLKELGSGEFGTVSLGALQQGPQPMQVAVKTVRENLPESQQEQFEREARLLVALHHRNIVKVLAVCFASQPHMIVLEYMEGGDLKSYLEREQKVLEQQPTLMTGALVQVAEAMAFMSKHKVVHRDLAARNVLVGSRGLSSVKLSDVGLSRPLMAADYYRKRPGGKIPAKWMAPESLFERVCTSASDVWSYGVLCWEVFSYGAEPYADHASIEDAVRWLMRGNRLARPESCPPELYVAVSIRVTSLTRQVRCDAAVLADHAAEPAVVQRACIHDRGHRRGGDCAVRFSWGQI